MVGEAGFGGNVCDWFGAADFGFGGKVATGDRVWSGFNLKVATDARRVVADSTAGGGR